MKTAIQCLRKAGRMRSRLQDKRGALYRVAYSWCHDPALADDLVQDTLAKALVKVNQLRELERIDPWLFRILSNCWKDHLRARREMQNIDDLVLASPRTPVDSYREQEIFDRVRGAVAQLPLGQRQVLTLVDLEGMTYAEVADILQIPVGTVMSRLSRARAAMAERLRGYREAQADPPMTTKLRSVK